MAWCLLAPSHYLHQCWLTINQITWHLFQSNIYLNIQDINPQAVFAIHRLEITEYNELSSSCHWFKFKFFINYLCLGTAMSSWERGKAGAHPYLPGRCKMCSSRRDPQSYHSSIQQGTPYIQAAASHPDTCRRHTTPATVSPSGSGSPTGKDRQVGSGWSDQRDSRSLEKEGMMSIDFDYIRSHLAFNVVNFIMQTEAPRMYLHLIQSYTKI